MFVGTSSLVQTGRGMQDTRKRSGRQNLISGLPLYRQSEVIVLGHRIKLEPHYISRARIEPVVQLSNSSSIVGRDHLGNNGPIVPLAGRLGFGPMHKVRTSTPLSVPSTFVYTSFQHVQQAPR